jgi:hypothetical protein
LQSLAIPIETFLLGGYRQVGGLAVLLVGRFDGRRFKFAGRVTQGLRGASRLRLSPPKGLNSTNCPFLDLPNRRHDSFAEGVTREEMQSFVWVTV